MQIAERISPSQLGAYYECCKPKVVYLILFTAFVGMLLSTDGMVPLDRMFWGLLGIGLAAAAGAALNHVIDEEIDQRMERTRSRPVAQGILPPLNVVMFACTLAILSTLILLTFVNTLTALLTLASMVGYAIIYTLFLKRSTPQNIVIGGAAGALPPVVAWAAATGSLSVEPLLLFLIIFFWTPPHFWALALFRSDDYARANVPMLPVVAGGDATRLQILLYTIVLVAVAAAPWPMGYFDAVYGVSSLVLGAGMLYLAAQVYRRREGKAAVRAARRLFGFSILYLFALFAILLLEVVVAAAMPMLFG